MRQMTNRSGEPVSIPALGQPGFPRTVEPGETVEFEDELAAGLDPEVWGTASGEDPRTVAELRELVKAKDPDAAVSGKTKPELLKMLEG